MTSRFDQDGATVTLGRDWLNAMRYSLRGRRGLILAAIVIAGSALALNWSWLFAVGMAPLLLSVLPCIAMCGLGLCMNRTAGRSCSASAKQSVASARRSRPAPGGPDAGADEPRHDPHQGG
jgi:hypothetical protein